MRIHKILNNNAIIFLNKTGHEQIAMGAGIAYKRKAGEKVEEALIDKVFSIDDESNKMLKTLLSDIPIEYFSITEEIVQYAKRHTNKALSDTVYIALIDHIYTSVKRHCDGITLPNPMIWDIRRFYPDELEVGKYALAIIKNKKNIQLSDDEAGFVALHIVNAQTDNKSIDEIYELTRIMQEISNIVKYHFHIEFDESSVYFYRFVTHLRFFVQRLLSNKRIENQENELLDLIKGKYQNAYSCVCKIEEFVKKQYHYCISDEEKLYLTIHIERLIYKTNH